MARAAVTEAFMRKLCHVFHGDAVPVFLITE